MGFLIGGQKTVYLKRRTLVLPREYGAIFLPAYMKKGGTKPPFGRPPNWVSHE